MTQRELDKHLKAVLGWLYSAKDKEDQAVKNSIAILKHVLYTIPKEDRNQ
jgi:hypothetical protein